MSDDQLKAELTRHEAKRAKPYLDCCGRFWRECTCIEKGKLTIGVGRNLDDVGLRDDEIDHLLTNDIARVRAELDQSLPWWREAPEAVQGVIVNLGFNLGVLTPPGKAKLLMFTQTLNLMKSGRYAQAADNLTKTLWHRQVKGRAIELENILRGSQEA